MHLKNIFSTQICASLALLLVVSTNAQSPLNVTISAHDITVLVSELEQFDLYLSHPPDQEFDITFVKEHDLVDIIPPVVEIRPGASLDQKISLLGKNPGHFVITSELSQFGTGSESVNIDDVFIRVTVANSWPLIYISIVVGWVYFVAWSVSFYPQIYINWRRKSVVGLNFDFLALNVVGHSMYTIFNAGLFWDAGIQQEYYDRNPRGLNPVLVNDLVFAMHAVLATLVTIGQCFVYERAQQRVSYIARSILGFFALCIVVFIILGGTDVIHWLDFLYYLSYIKLAITLIKYVPQAVMNYRRKSTVGWSIGNILLDFTGGILSMLQMILNAHNYDDWASIFGDPTKFGLGLFSVLFDILFIVQHYILYRHARQKLGESDIKKAEPAKSENA